MPITSTQINDTTVSIYDNFYSTQINANASEYDVVYSYFKGTSNNSVIAGNFTSLLFRIAKEGNYNVMDLLQILKGNQNNKLQMNSIICYYLNTFRPRAALYGVGIIPKPNEAVQRNVVL